MLKSLFQRLCALSLGLGIACAAQAQPTKVTYLLPAPPNSPAFAPWIIAKEKGYYTAQDLDLTFIAAKGGVDVAKQIGAGNALRWRYVLSLPVDDKVYDVHLDDWMYLIDENTLANRSFMSKFGVEVGQVTLFFRKRNE